MFIKSSVSALVLILFLQVCLGICKHNFTKKYKTIRLSGDLKRRLKSVAMETSLIRLKFKTRERTHKLRTKPSIKTIRDDTDTKNDDSISGSGIPSYWSSSVYSGNGYENTSQGRNKINRVERKNKRTFVSSSLTPKMHVRKLKFKLTQTIVNALKLLLDKKNHFQKDARALTLARVLDMRNDTFLRKQPIWFNRRLTANTKVDKNVSKKISVLKTTGQNSSVSTNIPNPSLSSLNQKSFLKGAPASSYRKSSIKLDKRLTSVNPTELGLSILRLLFGEKAHLVVSPQYKARLKNTSINFNPATNYDRDASSKITEIFKKIKNDKHKEELKKWEGKNIPFSEDEKELGNSVAALSSIVSSGTDFRKQLPSFTQLLAKEASWLIKYMTTIEQKNLSGLIRNQPEKTKRLERFHKFKVAKQHDEDNTRKSWVLLKMPKTSNQEFKPTINNQDLKPSYNEVIKIIQPTSQATMFSPNVTRDPSSVSTSLVQGRTNPETKLDSAISDQRSSTVKVFPENETITGFSIKEIQSKREPGVTLSTLRFDKSIASLLNELKGTPEKDTGNKLASDNGASRSVATQQVSSMTDARSSFTQNKAKIKDSLDLSSLSDKIVEKIMKLLAKEKNNDEINKGSSAKDSVLLKKENSSMVSNHGSENAKIATNKGENGKEEINIGRSNFYLMLISALKDAYLQYLLQTSGGTMRSKPSTTDVAAKTKTSLPVPATNSNFQPAPLRAVNEALSSTKHVTSKVAPRLSPSDQGQGIATFNTLLPSSREPADEAITSMGPVLPHMNSEDNVLFQSDTGLGETRNVHDNTENKKIQEDLEVFAEKGLAVHNKYRSLHGSPELKWSDELATKAEKLAYQMAMKGTIEKSPEVDSLGIGENVAKLSGSLFNEAGSDATKVWYSEIKNYSFSDPRLSPETDAFTQEVWKSSNELGMGIAKDTNTNDLYVVALYRPPGNNRAGLRANVLNTGGIQSDVYSTIFKRQRTNKKRSKLSAVKNHKN